MSSKKSVSSLITGKRYSTPTGNCTSKQLVYLAECLICQKQYTGKTVNKLQTRISGHRSHVGKPSRETILDSDEATLAEHLKEDHNFDSVELFNLSYVFTILQLDPRNLDKCEQKWIHELVTMKPYGLNIENPFGIADSLLSMSRKVRD